MTDPRLGAEWGDEKSIVFIRSFALIVCYVLYSPYSFKIQVKLFVGSMQEAKLDEVVPVMLIRGKMSAIVGLSVMICLCPIIFVWWVSAKKS